MNKFELLSSAYDEDNLKQSINKWFFNEPYQIVMHGKYKTIKKNGKILDHYRITKKNGRVRFEANLTPFMETNN
jgi:hypothetical protein|tara:strand:+ start:157 stop:378 length:222 start_codon:yes stop_codon:yes gene_type:complete